MKKIYLFLILLLSGFSFSGVREMPSPPNQVKPFVSVDVQKDIETGVYTYKYTVGNEVGSIQVIEGFYIELAEDIEIISLKAPKVWEAFHTSDNNLMWSALEVLPEDMPNPETWDGNLVESSFAIVQGKELAGFIIQTYSGPKEGVFYGEGFARMPVVDGGSDLPSEYYETLSYPDSLYHGTTTVPVQQP